MRACWQCEHPCGDALFCPSCKALQPPPGDYFAILGLPERLVIPEAELQKRFYELSRQLHPDRFVRKSEREREYSLEASSILNDAYRTLRDPVKRGEYILKRKGLTSSELRSKEVPPELLEEVFELNLALEEMRGGDESARPQLEEAEKSFAGMLAQTDGEMNRLFAAYDAQPDSAALSRIRAVLDRRKYIQNLVDEVAGTLV